MTETPAASVSPITFHSNATMTVSKKKTYAKKATTKKATMKKKKSSTTKKGAKSSSKSTSAAKSTMIPKGGPGPGVKMQDHIQTAAENKRISIDQLQQPKKKSTKKLTNKLSRANIPKQKIKVARMSENKVPINMDQPIQAEAANYNNKKGRRGPDAQSAGPKTRPGPMAVTDLRQLMLPSRNNRIPYENGVTNGSPFPQQQITNTPGGFHSGKTGPL